MMSPNEFYTRLAEQLIDNTLDMICTKSWVTPKTASHEGVSDIGPHLTPTSRK